MAHTSFLPPSPSLPNPAPFLTPTACHLHQQPSCDASRWCKVLFHHMPHLVPPPRPQSAICISSHRVTPAARACHDGLVSKSLNERWDAAVPAQRAGMGMLQAGTTQSKRDVCGHCASTACSAARRVHAHMAYAAYI